MRRVRWVALAVTAAALGAGSCGTPGREGAAVAMAAPAGRDPYAALVEAMRSAQPPLQAYACEVFLEADQAPPVDEVRTLLADADPRVRMLAVTVLGAMRRADLAAVIRERQRDGEPVVRLAAAFAMAMVGTPTEMNSLRDALASPDVSLRRTAAWLLGLMANRSAAGMLKVKLDDPDAVVALRTAEALHRLGSDAGLEAVRTLTAHDRHEVRCWAVRLLGEMGVAEDIPLLERLCQSQFLDVKFAAIGALARRGDLKRIDLLLKVLDEPDRPGPTTEGASPKEGRILAMRALADSGYTPAVERLGAVLAKGDLMERTAAAGAIIGIRSTKQPWRSRALVDQPAPPPQGR